MPFAPWTDPDGQAVFNVGGGVIFNSSAGEEYDECLLNVRYLLALAEQARAAE